MRIGDMEDMTHYQMVYGSEGAGSKGCSGVKIFVRRYPETLERLAALSDHRPDGRLSDKEKANSFFGRVGRHVEQLVSAQAANLDPKTWEGEAKTKAEFEKAFKDAGLGPVFMEPIDNEYWPQGIPEARIGDPWYNVATPIGYIKIGWRKRVINIDWARTTLRSLIEEKYSEGDRLPGGEELFPTIVKEGETTTLGDHYVHAYGYEKATKYLKAMHDHSQKDGGVRKLQPKRRKPKEDDDGEE